MKLGYADPPYIGCANLYKDQPDFGGEVDHAELIERLETEYDGWVLHAAATAKSMAVLGPLVAGTDARWCSWVKGFAAFKRNVSVAYAWEPVLIKAARKPVVSKRQINRDWIQESITLKRGLTGAKPEAVCHWAFELLGARPDDELCDLFPGTGAVTKAWATWQGKFVLPEAAKEFGGKVGVTWQPIETAPRDGSVVLVYSPGWFEGGYPARWCKEHGHSHWMDLSDGGPLPEVYSPTHWLPVPGPPFEGDSHG